MGCNLRTKGGVNMGKNIIIQEGSSGKQMTVDKLKTDLVGGGSCLWVPEDGTELGTKYINADGTYKASSDGFYGYSEVTVRGTGKATGKDSDGDDAYAYTDPTTGRLVTEKLPSSIVVTVNPSKLTYFDGETINFTGMVVKAYLATGGLWTDSSHPNGVIPISELVFPVTQADYTKVHADEYSDGNGLNAILISYETTWDVDSRGRDIQRWLSNALGTYEYRDKGYTAMLGGNGYTSFYATFYNDKIYVFGSTEDRNLNGWYYDGELEHDQYNVFLGSSFTSGTGEVKSAGANIYEWATAIPESTVEPTGSETLQPVDAYQEIPVQWTRPNGDVLETSFRITVVPSN